MIPKVIHYCWFGNKKIPRRFKRYIKTWKKYCPDYEIKEWNETNYNTNQNLFIQEAAKAKKWAFVSDYLRFDVLEKYGGIYLDIDVELLKSFDPLLKYSGFCGFECSNYVNFGSAVGSEPHNPIIKEMKEYIQELHYSKETFKNETGPIIQTKIFMKHGMKNDQTEQEIEGFHIFPPEYFCPMNYSQIIDNLTKNTYSIHHFAATWFDKKELRKFKWNNFKTRIKFVLKKIFKYNF